MGNSVFILYGRSERHGNHVWRAAHTRDLALKILSNYKYKPTETKDVFAQDDADRNGLSADSIRLIELELE